MASQGPSPGRRLRQRKARWSRLRLDLLFLTVWSAGFGAIWLGNRSWPAVGSALIKSPAGFQAVMQVVPAAIFALFVLIYGSIFVMSQHIVPSRGSRSTRLLLLDPQLRALVTGAVVLVVAAVAIAGTVPADDVTDSDRALAATLEQATAAFVIWSTVALTGLYHRYSSPQGFASRLLSFARKPWALTEASKVLRQWACTAARGSFSLDLAEAGKASQRLYAKYIAWCRKDARLLDRPPGDNEPEAGWMGRRMGDAFVRAAEEAVRAQGPWRDLDQVVSILDELIRQPATRPEPQELTALARWSRWVTRRLVRDAPPAGELPAAALVAKKDADELIDAIARIGLLVCQSDAGAQRGWFQRTQLTLAKLVSHFQATPGDPFQRTKADLRACALAGWAQVGAARNGNPNDQSNTNSLQYVTEMGDEPPWDSARDYLASQDTNPKRAGRVVSAAASCAILTKAQQEQPPSR